VPTNDLFHRGPRMRSVAKTSLLITGGRKGGVIAKCVELVQICPRLPNHGGLASPSLRFSSNRPMQYSYVLQQGTLTAKAKQQQNGAHFHSRCRITLPNVIRYVNPFSPLLLLLNDEPPSKLIHILTRSSKRVCCISTGSCWETGSSSSSNNISHSK
jgi:hypothetical protein